MSRAKPLTVGRHHFPRQLDAIEFFREMLSRYEVGATVSSDDSEDLLALLARHIDCKNKIGVGVSSFCVMVPPDGGRCFGVVRVDGSRDDFSFMRCISGKWS